MLPHIDAKDWHKDVRHRVLIFSSDDLQLLLSLGLDKPSPATALDPEELCRKGLLELLQAAPSLFDLGYQRLGCAGLCLRAGSRCQVLPEEAVVDVATAVEVDR